MRNYLQNPGDYLVDPRLRLSQNLIRSGGDTSPVQHWTQGLSRLAQGLMGGYLNSQAIKDKNKAMNAYLASEPDSYSKTPTINDQQIMESPEVQNIITGKTDAELMQNPMMQRSMNGIGYEQDRIIQAEQRIKEAQDKKLLGKFGNAFGNHAGGYLSPEHADRDIGFEKDTINKANSNIDRYGDNFNRAMSQLRGNELTEDQKADALAQQFNQQRKNSMESTLNPKMPSADYAMQKLRELKSNPYAQNLLNKLTLNKMQRDFESQIYSRNRRDALQDMQRGEDFKSKLQKEKLNADTYTDRSGIERYKTTGEPVAKNSSDSGFSFQGKGMDAQTLNVLLHGDPRTPEYAAAYGHYGAEKATPDPVTGAVVRTRPDMSMFKPPVMPNSSIATQPSSVRTGKPVGSSEVVMENTNSRPKPFNEFQSKSGGFYSRMLDANKELENLFSGPDGISGNSDDLKKENVYSKWEFAKEGIPFVGNAFNSPHFQRARQAMKNWVTANLRLESGAAIPPEEQEQEFLKWFPAFGDSPEVVAQKERARKQVEENMRTQSQGAYEELFAKDKKVNSNPQRRTGEANNGWKIEKVN